MVNNISMVSVWTGAFALLCARTVIATSSIAHGLNPPTQGFQHQQAFGAHGSMNEDDISSIPGDSEGLTDLFWELTSNDIKHVSGKPEFKDYHVDPGQIAYGHQTRGPPLGLEKEQSSDHPASLEIYMSTIGGYPIYHTPIAVGSPPQPFNAWLNTNLDGLYVRSSACSKEDCSTGFSYDPNKSKHRKSLEQRFELYPEGWTVGGNVSTDTLHLVSLQVGNATVGDIDKYEGEELFYYVMEFVVDGALGLAPPNAETAAYSPLLRPNPLFDLFRSQAVEHNVLTLTLPSSTEDRGSLQVGQPSRPHKQTFRIPFGNETLPGLANTWHIPLSSVSLAGQIKFHVPLESVNARLDLEPTIMLPPNVTKELYKAIGADPNSLFRGASIDCKAREKLPDLVLNVGGYDIRMTKDEYSAEYIAYGRSMCVVAILPSEDENVAVLGTHVLTKYHVVIDIDEGELGLEARHLNS